MLAGPRGGGGGAGTSSARRGLEGSAVRPNPEQTLEQQPTLPRDYACAFNPEAQRPKGSWGLGETTWKQFFLQTQSLQGRHLGSKVKDRREEYFGLFALEQLEDQGENGSVSINDVIRKMMLNRLSTG